MDDQKDDKNAQRACDIEIFKIVSEHFRQDIREFWTRANFYLLTHTALFSAFIVIYPTLTNAHISIGILVPILGLSISIFWFIVLRGAVYWIQQWREQVIKLSKELDRFQCYCEVENLVKQKKFLSPSYLTKYLPLIFAVAWLAILVLVVFRI
jgi:hypothetical protein